MTSPDGENTVYEGDVAVPRAELPCRCFGAVEKPVSCDGPAAWVASSESSAFNRVATAVRKWRTACGACGAGAATQPRDTPKHTKTKTKQDHTDSK